MGQKVCSKCKTDFECGSEKSSCWCEDLTIELDTLHQIKKEFDNCLCTTCLKVYSNNKLNN